MHVSLLLKSGDKGSSCMMLAASLLRAADERGGKNLIALSSLRISCREDVGVNSSLVREILMLEFHMLC